ncbi:Hypothetical protein Minf_1074 [Methylacidiphilum infernorum V4]|uniref:Uncharacterized protein n=1 Tax=Methylacidiphilum infernorum (isolate V4) TaxID=481448 RepID=B3DUX6_METI4|nr:Hypothetical protein Minf_1074 [Methylacidiphilum infernorum V4]
MGNRATRSDLVYLLFERKKLQNFSEAFFFSYLKKY